MNQGTARDQFKLDLMEAHLRVKRLECQILQEQIAKLRKSIKPKKRWRTN